MKALLSFSAIFAFLFAVGVQTFEPFKMEKQEYSSTSALEKQLRKEFTFDCNGNYYEEMWKKIDSLERKGMTREALDLTEKIFAQSKQENNGNQNVKYLVYIMKYKQVMEENSNNIFSHVYFIVNTRKDILQRKILTTTIPSFEMSLLNA